VIAHFLLRNSGWALLLSAAGVAACSNSPPPPPDTFVNAAVGGGAGGACSSYPGLQRWLQIGSALSGHPNTVQDGGNDRNANVSVSCTVHPQGSGFDIDLSAIEDGPNGGSLTITSPSGAGKVTTMTSTGVSAKFVGQSGIVYREEAGAMGQNGVDPGCTITYVYDPGGSVGGVANEVNVPTTPPIAAGRIWGHVKCPSAAAQAQNGVYCDAEADFIFEQCQQ
jgi:hypothetical protein